MPTTPPPNANPAALPAPPSLPGPVVVPDRPTDRLGDPPPMDSEPQP